MKTTENILEEYKDAFLWEDNETIDITIKDDSKTFIENLIDYKCLKCETNVVIGNEKLCQGIDDNVRGIEITCKSCNQRWFIHEKFVTI